jgi:hypothetical protein
MAVCLLPIYNERRKLMRYKLERKSTNRSVSKYHILNEKSDIVGSVCIPLEEEADLLGHWNGQANRGQSEHQPVANANQCRLWAECLKRWFCEDANDMNGIAAMVKCADWLQEKLSMEVLSIGRGGLEPENSHVLEICGRSLLYVIKLDGCERILLSMQLLDSASEPGLFLNIDDGPEGWRTICRLVAALERNECRSLKRPIEAGTGSSGFVIA